jgi:plastocyanin
MRKRRWIAACGIVVGAACGSSGGDDPFQPPPGPAVMADTVTIVDNSFGPETVKITNGGTVTWIWSPTNTMQHNVLWGTVPAGAMPPSGPTQATGAPFEVTFTQVGTYEFVCTLHVGMQGAVFVE